MWRPLDNDILAAHHGLDEYNGEDEVQLSGPDDVGPIELEINLPIIFDDSYTRTAIEPGYEEDDTRVKGALILQENLMGTEIEPQNPTVEMTESRQR